MKKGDYFKCVAIPEFEFPRVLWNLELGKIYRCISVCRSWCKINSWGDDPADNPPHSERAVRRYLEPIKM